MAEEVPYGQLSRADEILEEIKDSTLKQEIIVGESMLAANLSNTIMLDIAAKDDLETEYAAQQQGQEVAYSRIMQHMEEKTVAQMEEMNLEPSKKGGIASADAQAEGNGYLAELKETAGRTLKAQIESKWQVAKNRLEEHAQFSQFVGTLKNDLNLFTGQLQMLTQIPGITTLLGSIKYILSTLSLFLIKRFPLLFKPIISMINKLRGKKLGDEGYIELPSDKKKREKVEDPGEWVEDHDPTRKGYTKWKEQKDAFDAQEDAMEEAQGFWGSFKSGMTKMKDGVKNLFKEDSMLMRGFNTIGDKLKSGVGYIKGAFSKLGGMLSAVGKAVWTAVAGLVSAIWAGIVSAFTAAVAALATITAPVWLVIAAVLLIAIGMWIFWEEIKVAWAKTKQWFYDSIDTIKSWGPKIKQLFSDAGEYIVYTFKRLIAKLKDGIFTMANGVIDKLNKALPERWEIEKFDTDNVEALDKDWQERQLAKRNPADAQKALDEATDNKELTMNELRDKLGTQAPTVPVVTNVNNQNVRSHYTGSPKPRDEVLRVQNSVR